MSAAPPTPADVLKYSAPTNTFLCPLSANTFGIDFLSFKIRDVESKRVIFEVAKDPNAAPPEFPPNFDFDQLRHISYKFPADFLRTKTVGTTLTFKVGSKPVRNFRMIERHYFKDKLMQSYDFNFKFCIPDTTNEWEAIYQMPQLSDAEVADIIASPELSKSDSFYFVEGVLIMHNKATYSYIDNKKSAAAGGDSAAAPPQAGADGKSAPKSAAGGSGSGSAPPAAGGKSATK